MPSFIAESGMSASLDIPTENQPEGRVLGVPSLQPCSTGRGRILETVPLRQSGSTVKHKRKEEMIQKHLAHRNKRASSEPPPLERPETETDCTCSEEVSNKGLSTPSPFFNRLAKVKHMQQELREQQRPAPPTGNQSYGSTAQVSEMKTNPLLLKDRRRSTSDIVPDTKILNNESTSTEPNKDENRDIRINIVRRRGGSLSKLPGGPKDARYTHYKEKPTTQNEEPPVPAKSIPLAKLREHRRRKLGIVSPVIDTLVQNEININNNDDNLPSNSHSSESLGSLVTASTGMVETEVEGITRSKLPKNKLAKTFSQSSGSLGSLATASWPWTATEVGVIVCPAITKRNIGKNANDSPLDSNLTDPEGDSHNIPSQISESLGSLETVPTPLTVAERGEITYTTTAESEGYEASLDNVTESGTTGSSSTSHKMHEFAEWASFENTVSVVGESATSMTSSVDLNSGHYLESMPFGRYSVLQNGREPVATNQKVVPTEGLFHAANSSSANEQTDAQAEGQSTADDDASAPAPLALSSEERGKSFDFREIEDTEKVFIDPSWDANKVYFNEFDNGKKSSGKGADLFENQNDDWVSPSPVIFSTPTGPYIMGGATSNGITTNNEDDVEEEKKERDTVSLEGVLETELVDSGSNFVDFGWPIKNEYTADSSAVTAGPVSESQNLLDRNSEADDTNLLSDSGSSRDGSGALLRKEERLREYNTLEVDEESSFEESGSEKSEQDDFIPDYVPQTNLTEEEISSASEQDDFILNYVPQTKLTEEVISAASEQSDVFDFDANYFPGHSSHFVTDKRTITALPLKDAAQIAFDISDDVDESSQSLVPWDEKETSSRSLSIPLEPGSLPPPPPPSPRASFPKKSRSASKGSTSIPLVAPPPAEKLKKWEEEKARPAEYLNKLHSTRNLPPPPPPPLPPKSFFHHGRRKRKPTHKQAIEARNVPGVVIRDMRIAEKVDTAISAASLKFEEHISSHGFTTSTTTNGQQSSSSSGLPFGARNDQSRMAVTDDGNREGIEKSYHCQESEESTSRRRWVNPDRERSPFGEAISKVPVLLSRILEFLGDPVAVCRVKMLNRGCKEYVEGNEHLLMRSAVRLGGMSMQVRPAFWLWVTLEKMENQRNGLGDEGRVEKLELQGREGKWHSVIERDVARAFGNLPPHKSGARLRTDSIVRALVSWGRGRMIKRGVKGDGEAPPRLSASNSYDSDITPTDTVSDWGAVAPASSTASELDESSRLKNNINEVPPSHDEERGELALGGSVLGDDLKVELRGKLRFVLHALAASNPDVGYCQGMDYVVAHLLRILQETIRWKAALGTLPDIIESAPSSIDVDCLTQEVVAGQYSKIDRSLVVEETLFHVMESFFGTYNLRHFYYPELRCLKTCCRVFERLIQLKLPVLADHFEHHELNVGLFALGWFQTLFLYLPSMPSATVCHMWDIWLVERSFKIFFRVGTAILFLSQPILLNHELEGMMSYLNTFPDATLLSPDILIACALQIKVTNKLLMELEREVISTM